LAAKRKAEPGGLFADKSDAELLAALKATRRQIAVAEARGSLLAFARLMMPHPEDPADSERSLYVTMPHHKTIALAYERIESGRILRSALAIPPQHGKSLLTLFFIAWFIGRNPRKNVIFGSYNDTFSRRSGSMVLDMLNSRAFKEIFPGVVLAKGSKAKDAMRIEGGGELNFIGRGGSGTGLNADLIVIDDPLKNAEEAGSSAVLEELHEWFSKVIRTRMRNTTRLAIIQTRWVEDDLIGRQCDPDHPNYDQGRASKYIYINVPAVITDAKLAKALSLPLEMPDSPEVIAAFGCKPMAALWPLEFSLEHLAAAKTDDPRAFEALYMGRPTPEDGEYFKKQWLVEYRSTTELPKHLANYGASDHALTEKKQNDATVLGVVGVDERGDIWVLPDLVWERMATDRTVDEMIGLMKAHSPYIWWAEGDSIGKAIGPFLERRKQDESVHTYVEAMPPHRDKMARARSIQGFMSMRKVHFPSFAPWFGAAKAEMLKFPYGTHDDFVDFLAWIGVGVDRLLKGRGDTGPKLGIVHASGSIEWILQQSKMKAANDAMQRRAGGW
jgi:predicted phage terminase large subunit-like protein